MYLEVAFNDPNKKVQNLYIYKEILKTSEVIQTTTYTTIDGYRYAFQGQEKDDEAKGKGNSYTTEFRQYDPRLGRWLSVDPLANKAPGWSPYRFGFDNPIYFSDRNGLYEHDGHYWTVLLVATMLKLENAQKIAYWSEYPDHIMNNNHDIEKSTNTWLDPELQSDWHAFGGTHAQQKAKYQDRIATAMQNGDLEALGIALHGLGDSFSHRNMKGNGSDMYHVGVGHAHHGHKPDKIANRPKTYKWYVRTLVESLGGDSDKFNFDVFNYVANKGLSTEENAGIFRVEFGLISHDFTQGSLVLSNLNEEQKKFIENRKFSNGYEVVIEQRARAICVDKCNDTWKKETFYEATITQKK